jgi:hypothetical protein
MHTFFDLHDQQRRMKETSVQLMGSILNVGGCDGLRKAYWDRYKHEFN